MGESVAMIRTWRVGKRTCTLTAPKLRNGEVLSTAMEWSPDMPRRLSRREWKQYRTGRDKAFAELFQELGVRGAVLEI